MKNKEFKNLISQNKFNSFSDKQKRQFLISKNILLKRKNVINYRSYSDGWLEKIYYEYFLNQNFINEIFSSFLENFDCSSKKLIKIVNQKIILNKDNIVKIKNDYLATLERDIDLYHFVNNGILNSKKMKEHYLNRVESFNYNISERMIETHIIQELELIDFNDFNLYIEVIDANNIINFLNSVNNFTIDETEVIDIKTYGLKMMMLKELGIIDYLIKKYELDKFGVVNYNLLSKILTSFTGIKTSTINKTLSAIYKEPLNKNNPENKQNKNKIKAKFIELGLDIS